MIKNFIDFFNSSIVTPYIFFSVEWASLAFKVCLCIFLLLKGLRSKHSPTPLFFLMISAICSIGVDISWIIKLIREIFFPAMDYRYVVAGIRVGWIFNLLQFQALGLLIESLSVQHYRIKFHQRILFLINSIYIGCFLYFTFFHFNVVAREARSSVEMALMEYGSLYMIFILTLPSASLTIWKLKHYKFPTILKSQFKILLKYLICPYVLSELLQSCFFIFSPTVHQYIINSLSVCLLTFALYYSTRKVMGLRFLNFQNHVQSVRQFNFIDDFKKLLEQLSQVTNIQELGYIAQNFFKEAFGLIPEATSLYVRNLDVQSTVYHHQEISFIEAAVENFINRHSIDDSIAQYLRTYRILITDEIVFSNFYEENDCRKEIILFLEQINADIFVPIFERNTIVAYVIVARNARGDEFYSDVERDEMLVFASYLGNIIHLMQNRNLNSLIERERMLRHELYSKHQEINQYKESIQTFLRDTTHRKIGVVFFRSRKFVIANQAAQELLGININTAEGHPLTKAIKRIAHQAQEYKTNQMAVEHDARGNKLVISALPHTEHNNVIIMLYYPEIADLIKQQIDCLKDPSAWDYLLYLETTKAGALINQLIPGNTTTLLNFKIELLKLALSNKAIVLDMPEDDLVATVEILHHINMRETLHIINLQAPVKNYEIAIKLFGINPIFGSSKELPLFETLSNTGTIFIKNIHYLDIETQEYLAGFIKYGYCQVFKSDQRIASNVRIIFSTTQNLSILVQEGKFSRILYNELYHGILVMPSLMQLKGNELEQLAQGFSKQAVSTQAFHNILMINDREANKLLQSKPVSLQELKTKIHHLLEEKSKKSNIYQEVQFDPAYHVTDPDLAQAARLGKKALKDPKIMAFLWQKFKNQNKMAALLGVNRSSINRRCKEYNLM